MFPLFYDIQYKAKNKTQPFLFIAVSLVPKIVSDTVNKFNVKTESQ